MGFQRPAHGFAERVAVLYYECSFEFCILGPGSFVDAEAKNQPMHLALGPCLRRHSWGRAMPTSQLEKDDGVCWNEFGAGVSPTPLDGAIGEPTIRGQYA